MRADPIAVAEMRAKEMAVIQSGVATGRLLMERAGAGVVQAIFSIWPELRSPHETGPYEALVLCGPGNNGGDGFVIARLLRRRGWNVRVFFAGKGHTLPVDARANYDLWCRFGGVCRDPNVLNRGRKLTLVVDALFGIGLSRPMPAAIQSLVHRLQDLNNKEARPHLVSVDIPSGVASDTGALMGEVQFRADLTVTFHRPKPCHNAAQSGALCGQVKVVDIGLDTAPPALTPWRPNAALWAGLNKAHEAHKFSHGHAVVLSGGPGRTGAARLAALGALRVGAGLVTLGAPARAQAEIARHITALMQCPVDEPADLIACLQDRRIKALCVGPGFGLTCREADLIEVVLSSRRPCVLDADALTLISRYHRLFARLHENCILTPHEGEFSRLFPDLVGRSDRLSRVEEAARRAGAHILLKGPKTVIATPGGDLSLVQNSDPKAAWLATAGSGDVLAGLITGLMARGFSPAMAAPAGAWIHQEAALFYGPGLISEDIPRLVAQVLAKYVPKL